MPDTRQGEGRRRGRRPGGADTRAEILATAGRLFSERGFDRTSMRVIARQARVDPALVSHYFDSKEALFLEAVELPIDPELVLGAIVADDRQAVGHRVAQLLVALLEEERTRARLTSLIRAAASEPTAAALVRELVQSRVLAPIARALDSDEPELRASLASSQIVGLVMARHVVGVEPLASLTSERIVALLAPTLQRYLAGPLETAQ
jgi:AcrR family transcriptional regulator